MALSREQLTFRSALSRLLVGTCAIVMLPLLFPLTRPHVWILGVYLVGASIEQALILKNIGGKVRAFIAGLVDLFVVTYFIHLLGSTTTVLAAVYFFTCTLNTLVVGLRVGITIAALQAIAYDLIVWAEWARWLPYAPAGPEATRNVPPTFETSLTATTLVTVFLVASTAVVGMLVHSVRRHEADLMELSQRDPLTGLYNRRHLFAKLEHELARVRRGHGMGLVMLDLDGFKRVNDTQGHLRGDLLLKEIATALAASTRVIDVAARYGGDEFMLVLPDTDLEQARVVGERVVAAVRDAGVKFDTHPPVTASIGVAVARADDVVASIIRRADENAYRAKQEGGDRVVLGA